MRDPAHSVDVALPTAIELNIVVPAIEEDRPPRALIVKAFVAQPPALFLPARAHDLIPGHELERKAVGLARGIGHVGRKGFPGMLHDLRVKEESVSAYDRGHG